MKSNVPGTKFNNCKNSTNLRINGNEYIHIILFIPRASGMINCIRMRYEIVHSPAGKLYITNSKFLISMNEGVVRSIHVIISFGM